jgi:hypothetical protein
MTKRENFEAIKNVLVQYGTQEQVACIEHEIELLNRKSTTPKKPTATQVENEKFKTAIVEYLGTADKPVTVKDIMALPTFEGISNQRVTHLLTALRTEGKVARTYVKKVAYFALGTEETTEESVE